MTDLLYILPNFNTAPFQHLLPSLERSKLSVVELLALEPIDIARSAQIPLAEIPKLTNALREALLNDVTIVPSNDIKETKQPGVDQANEASGDAPTLTKDEPTVTGNDEVNHLISSKTPNTISILDSVLDEALSGGFPTGHVIEITGESGAGKTQFLLTLLLSAQLQAPHGVDGHTLYIATEAELSTSRLHQLLSYHPYLESLPTDRKPTLERVLNIRCPDLESQEHILRFQVPVITERYNIKLIIIDSIAANFRAELDGVASSSNHASLAQRSQLLITTGTLLHRLARQHNLCIVVANQVADRFTSQPGTSTTASGLYSERFPQVEREVRSSPLASSATDETENTESRGRAWFSQPDTFHNYYTYSHERDAANPTFPLDVQLPSITGWGDEGVSATSTRNAKTPSLGLVWTQQLCARIALLKEPIYSITAHSGERDLSHWRRWMKIVFADWTAEAQMVSGRLGVEFVIEEGGLRACSTSRDEENEK